MSKKKATKVLVTQNENMIWSFVLVFSCAALYTCVRYTVFGDVPKEHIPVFLVNKTLSMCSVLCLFMAAVNYAMGKQMSDKASFWGKASLQSAYVHIILSLAILSKAYYPKFFGEAKLNAMGELIILVGMIAAYCFWLLNKSNASIVKRSTLQLLATLFIGVHLIVMGFSGWTKVAKWHGSLPPISLVSFAFALIAFILFMKREKHSKQNQEQEYSTPDYTVTQ